LVRAAIHCEFYRPARLDDRLRVAAYVARVGTKSLTLNFDIVVDAPRELGAAGYQVLVCVERETLRPRALPPEVVEALRPYTLTPAAARATLGVAAP
jgi:acyl-CoA thioesterase FadM